ncbi:fusaric acid resistance family protein [Actinomycetospora succinea]|uniref:Fusaric acid resistance family protein n=1 Tax=Actinomycetospora succinea TaxID=663603 RepID=A0A4R6VHW8_9PSEU|nr:FUSC family protein [Actinomycetospora succinea]TDQ61060.1 fusaric acid resistance family protein [Actinomycetospora succinea]
MRGRRSGRSLDLRTWLAGIDPGLTRLRLASIAVAAMVLAVGVVAVGRALLAPAEPVTVLLFAGVLAMVSNLAVNEPDLPRRRVTTALMILPAAASTVAGAFVAPYRIPAAAAFVAVMVLAVWVRRYGPRGFALGMAGFMPFFFTQFLRVAPAQVPWLLLAMVVGIASTLLLRGVVFAERPARTLRRMVTAFRARAFALVGATDAVLADVGQSRLDERGPDERDLEALRRARARLQEVSLLVEDTLEQTTAGRVWPGLEDDTLALRVADAELALERLSVVARRLALPQRDDAQEPIDAVVVAALRTGLRHLQTALTAGQGHLAILEAANDARAAVAGLVADTRPGRERVQRTAFAVRRVADAIHHAQVDAPSRRPDGGAPGAGAPLRPPPPPAGGGPAPDALAGRSRPEDMPQELPQDDRPGPASERPEDDDVRREKEPAPEPSPGGIALSTRQAVQVGVAATLAIVVGESIAPSRWYWAVITAFVVFAGTNSRGDLLSRGWGRVLGTVGGVVAGMGLAALVGGNTVLSLLLLFVCVFLALYLVRVSPSMLAFWITAVLALVYGLIGQFSVQVLVLRIEETAIGAVAAVVAAFLVLPRGTRAAFGDAVGEVVDAMDRVLAEATDRLVGRRSAAPAREGVRAMDDALATLRLRAQTLAAPFARRRARSSYQRGLRVLVVCDVYARSLARTADHVADPSWAATLDPAAAQVRANLDGLRDVLVRGRRASDGGQVEARSAERLVDAAEEHAARTDDPHRRATMLTAARLLRRIDQAVVGLAVDLGAAEDPDEDDADGDGQSPSTASSAGVANTRSGS